MDPRGIRNANPGNIRHGAAWEGLRPVQMDPDFCQFTDAVFGVRALLLTLRTYQETHGLRTLRGMIDRWAPPADHNDTSAYLASVCRRTSYAPDSPIDIRSSVAAFRVATAIIAQECADYAYPASVVYRAIGLASVADPLPTTET